MAVVFHHLDVLIAKEKYFGQHLFGFMAESGFRGVDLFFVISGFIMMHSCRSSPNRSRLDFLFSRIFRVFIPYLPIFIILTLVYCLNPGIAQGGVYINLDFILRNLLLLPRSSLESYVPVVAWTLTYEITFYIIFSLTLAKPTKTSLFVFGIWMIACFFNIWWKKQLMCLDPLNLAFGCGILAFYWRNLIRENRHSIVASFALFGLVLIMKYGGDRADNALIDIFFILLSGLLCATCLGVSPNIMSRLGDFSYSLYLCHYPIMAVSFMIFYKMLPEINPFTLSLLVIIASIYTSYIYYIIFERHLSTMAKNKFMRVLMK